MGSFRGHALPGLFFFVFGIWWCANVFYRFFCTKRSKSLMYKNSPWFCCPCTKSPIEPYLKIMMSLIGILGEFFTGFENGRWAAWGNAQHMTMYFFFGISGLVDIGLHAKWDLPPKLDYVAGVLAYSVEGFLFYHHLHGRTPLNIMLHMFLFYLILGCAISTILEMVYTSNVVPALSRVYFTLLQGTWFYQIAFTLYSPFGQSFDEMQTKHSEVMLITLMFAWHLAIVLLLMTAIGILMWINVRKFELSTKNLPSSPLEFTEDEIRPLKVEQI